MEGKFCYLCLRAGQKRMVGVRGFEPPTPGPEPHLAKSENLRKVMGKEEWNQRLAKVSPGAHSRNLKMRRCRLLTADSLPRIVVILQCASGRKHPRRHDGYSGLTSRYKRQDSDSSE